MGARLSDCSPGVTLNHIPRFDEQPILDAQDVGGDPLYKGAESRKPPVPNDQIALRHDRSRFLFQRRRKALYQVKQSITTRSDASAVLIVWRRPESLRRCIVTLMKSVSKALSTGDLFFSSSSLAIPCLLQSLTRKGVRCEIRKGDKSAPGARISALSPL
jgi:hypothetical protein